MLGVVDAANGPDRGGKTPVIRVEELLELRCVALIYHDLHFGHRILNHAARRANCLIKIVVAKRRKLIPALKPCLERLFEHGFHLSPEHARSLLKDVGED